VVPAEPYLLVSALLFTTGLVGFCCRRDVIVMLMSVELMLTSANIVFVTAGRALGTADGQVIAFFVIALAAAEVAVGLALVVSVFHNRASVDADAAADLKG
jgi:NADH-quinone oxidoreductase subunit K